jgi:hypothetical protein
VYLGTVWASHYGRGQFQEPRSAICHDSACGACRTSTKHRIIIFSARWRFAAGRAMAHLARKAFSTSLRSSPTTSPAVADRSYIPALRPPLSDHAGGSRTQAARSQSYFHLDFSAYGCSSSAVSSQGCGVEFALINGVRSHPTCFSDV